MRYTNPRTLGPTFLLLLHHVTKLISNDEPRQMRIYSKRPQVTLDNRDHVLDGVWIPPARGIGDMPPYGRPFLQ